MKHMFIFAIAFLLSGFSLAAKSIELSNTHQIDTLKKGKNYFLFSKTKDIQNVIFNKSKKSDKQEVKIHYGLPTVVPVTSTVFSTTIQVEKKYKAEDAEAFIFDKIIIVKGKYTDVVTTKETFTRNLFTFAGIEFPLHLKLISKDQTIDLELTEAGDWDVNIELKNN